MSCPYCEPHRCPYCGRPYARPWRIEPWSPPIAPWRPPWEPRPWWPPVNYPVSGTIRQNVGPAVGRARAALGS